MSSGAAAQRDDVLVVGAGAIGVCIAWYLARAGRKVTVVERGEVCSGCSAGNAGLISPSHSMPLAAPGVMGKGLRWLFDASSPLYIKPRLNLELVRWLWRFRAACSRRRMRKSLPVLRDLNRAGKDLYDELADSEGLSFGYERRGLTELFATARGRDEGFAAAETLRQFGIEARPMDAAEVRALEPGCLPEVIGGVHFPGDAHADPAEFVRRMARRASRRGATIRTHTEVIALPTSGRRIAAVQTTRGELRPRAVVLAAGAHTAGLARRVGLRLPVQPAKGYSITVSRPEAPPSAPLLLSEAKVAVTPLGGTVRFAGTLELAGLDLSVNARRVEAIRRAARRYHACGEGGEVVEIWRGLRPCTPDGLPVIGPTARCANLVIATGHGMKGICLAPITGKLVAAIVCGAEPPCDPAPFSPDRFR